MDVRRDGDGYRVRLAREERELLRRLARELRELVAAEDADPSLARLFPAAYDDLEAADEYDRLVRPGLVSGKQRALETLERTAGEERVSGEELESWLGALNDLRLVLGTRLGVTEQTYDEPPRDPGLALYGWLTWLEGTIVEALAAEL